MSDADDLQRDLDLIRRVADQSINDIAEARCEAEAALQRQLDTFSPNRPASQPETVRAAAVSDFDEDDYYRFQRFQR